MNQQARLPRELVIIKCGVAVFALRVVWKICCTLGGLTTLGIIGASTILMYFLITTAETMSAESDFLNEIHGSVDKQFSQQAVELLPIIQISESSRKRYQDCSICRDSFVIGESARLLPCLHRYHVDCIDPWLLKSGKCPVCCCQAFN